MNPLLFWWRVWLDYWTLPPPPPPPPPVTLPWPSAKVIPFRRRA